jgi:hypothetical protein
MRFNSLPEHLLTGFRALKIIELPLTTQPHGIQADTPEQVAARDGKEPVKVMVGLRALTPGERSEVLSAAYAYAISRGATGDIENSAVYQQSLAVYTAAMACVDHDSDRRAPILFFGDTLEQAADTIRRSPLMTDDTVVYLRERQEAFQDEVNPQALTVKDSELFELAQQAAKSADFLHYFRPAMLIRFTQTLAVLLLNSLEGNSGDTTASTVDGENSKTKPLKKTQKDK